MNKKKHGKVHVNKKEEESAVAEFRGEKIAKSRVAGGKQSQDGGKDFFGQGRKTPAQNGLKGGGHLNDTKEKTNCVRTTLCPCRSKKRGKKRYTFPRGKANTCQKKKSAFYGGGVSLHRRTVAQAYQKRGTSGEPIQGGAPSPLKGKT